MRKAENMNKNGMAGKFRLGVNTLFLVPGDVGGTETYLRQTLFSMVRLRPDVEFILFTNRENHSLFEKILAGFNNVSLMLLNFKAATRPVRILFEQLRLPFSVRKERVDVLWSPGYTAPYFTGCPQAVTVHDLQYKSHPDDMKFVERIVLDFLVKTACRKCDAIIAVSEFARQEILRFGFAGPEKVHAVLEGVLEDFAQEINCSSFSADSRIKKLINNQQKIILCVAHTYPHKNVHLLVDAMRLIYEDIPHHLVLVGSARRGEGKLQESLQNFPEPHRVHRLHGVEFSDLKILYSYADCFVLPSVYEGFGLPVLEAMMAGTPVVTTQKASIPEVGGKYAFYVNQPNAEEFAHKIKRVVQMQPVEREEYSRSAKEWAASFTWDKSALSTLNVFDRLIGNGQYR